MGGDDDFLELVNSPKPLTVTAEKSVFDVWLSSEYVPL